MRIARPPAIGPQPKRGWQPCEPREGSLSELLVTQTHWARGPISLNIILDEHSYYIRSGKIAWKLPIYFLFQYSLVKFLKLLVFNLETRVCHVSRLADMSNKALASYISQKIIQLVNISKQGIYLVGKMLSYRVAMDQTDA